MIAEKDLFDMVREKGRLDALALQEKSSQMTNHELTEVDYQIPTFSMAVKTMNMMDRKAGMKDGFVCKSSSGRVVRLLQNYDSNVFTKEPEELPAQWGFVHSKNPKKARPFIASATSPYEEGDCCFENGLVYRSKINNNVWAPSAYMQAWNEVGPYEGEFRYGMDWLIE